MTRRHVPLVAALAFVLLVATRHRPDEGPHVPPGPPDRSVARQLLDAHNAERRYRGLSPLVADDTLNAGARQWAEHMARTGQFRHAGGVAENIAWGYPDLAAVMRGWMASYGHRANILGSRYRRFGGGMARDRGGRPYWCARFE